MRGRRLLLTIRMYLTLSPSKRTNYLRKVKCFASIGDNCSIMDRKIPLYANLIKLGNNVHIASKVDLITHDIAHVMLNGLTESFPPYRNYEIKEKIGCIEIGDNVFVGSNTTILSNVRIGSYVVVGAGSLVNKDIPDNSVVAGVPARVIGSFDEFYEKRINEASFPSEFSVINEAIDERFADWLWTNFYKAKGIRE